MKRKIILYIAMSLDGFIASKDGSVGFLDPYNDKMPELGFNEFYSKIDSVIMGNTTFKQYGADFYKAKQIYVFSKTSKDKEENVTFVNEDVKEFANKLKGNVWMIGGSSIFNEFLKHNLIDEFIITIIPVLLGEGIPLFKDNELKLKFMNVKSFDFGVVQLNYKKI